MTMCGPQDMMSMVIRLRRWSPAYWVSLAAVPYALLTFKSRSLEAPLARVSALTLVYGYLNWRLREILVRQSAGMRFPLLPLPSDALSILVRQRCAVVLALMSVKRVYSLFRRRVISPLILGTRLKSTHAEQEQMALYDTHFEDMDMYEQDDDAALVDEEVDGEGNVTQTFSLFMSVKYVVEALCLPVVASTAGWVLRKTVEGALNVAKTVTKNVAMIESWE